MPNNHELLTFARSLAKDSGEMLAHFFDSSFQTYAKGINDVVTEADLAVEKMIIDAIRTQYPSHKIYSEETRQDKFDSDDYVWFIDPLDGTFNFSYRIPVFGVSIALQHLDNVQIGVINLPSTQDQYYASRGSGAFLNGKAINPVPDLDNQYVVLGAISVRKPELGQKLTRLIMQEHENIRKFRDISATAVALCIASNHTDTIMIDTTFKPWDIAAGALIATEAGLVVTDLQGNPWNTLMDSCLAAPVSLHASILSKLKEQT